MPRYRKGKGIVMRFILRSFDDDDMGSVTLEFQAVSLSEVLPELDRFLRGAGYFYKGNLDIIYDDESDD